MSDAPADVVHRIVVHGNDADDILRTVVAALASTPNVAWAAIAFAEDGALGLGPTSGEPDEARRTRVPISFDDASVGELWIDGEVPREELDRIAGLVAPYVLIGWDTGGEAWDP